MSSKWLPANLGAEPKKVAFLGGLLVVLVVVFFVNRTPSATNAGSPPAVTPAAPTRLAPLPSLASRVGGQPDLPLPPQRSQARRGEQAIQDFRPTFKLPEGTDVSRLDPELKLALLAQVRNLPLETARRSLFEFGAAPPPPVPKVAPVKPAPVPVASAAPPPPPTPATPVKPPPPPIPLKFYGYVSGRDAVTVGNKRAFFLEGEDIVVAGENDVIHGRYRVVRIDLNSAIIEDTTTKSQQTLPLAEEVQG